MDILRTLAFHLLKPLYIAIFLLAPPALYLIYAWLEKFKYSLSLDTAIYLYVLACAAALMLSLLVVAARAYKTINSSPARVIN